MMVPRKRISEGYLNFGNAVVRGPTSYLNLAPFELQGDVLHVASSIVEKTFRPYELRIITAESDDAIEYIEVRSLRIGTIEQLAVKSIPARVFGLDAFGVGLTLPVTKAGEVIAITLRNLSPTPVRLVMFLKGEAL